MLFIVVLQEDDVPKVCNICSSGGGGRSYVWMRDFITEGYLSQSKDECGKRVFLAYLKNIEITGKQSLCNWNISSISWVSKKGNDYHKSTMK